MDKADPKETALVLGAGGGIGGEVARQLRAAGWQVKALGRKLDQEGPGPDGLDWLRGDALDAASVGRGAEGCALIVHAVNPPGYRDWDKLVLPMLANTIAAAESQNALVVLPGTVYNYGPDAFPLIREDAPQHPRSRKGAIRVAMEELLRAYAGRGGRALVVRAGDYFGPRAGNNWFGQGLVKPGQAVTRIMNPARAGVGHQWSYLPDVAATMVALIARRHRLDAFARFHMAGHWDADGQAMARAIARAVQAAGGKTPRTMAFPWWLLGVLALFNPTMRELKEMRYLWETPVRMDNRRLVDVLGSEPHTPLDQAVAATLRGLGCLPADARDDAADAGRRLRAASGGGR